MILVTTPGIVGHEATRPVGVRNSDSARNRDY